MQRTLIIQILAAVLGAYLAHRKGRNVFAWAVACFFFPPVAIFTAFLPPVIRLTDITRCPACGVQVTKGSEACPRCGGGMPIDMAECPRCHKFVPDAGRCSECGSPL